jgi:hypothetical protein
MPDTPIIHFSTANYPGGRICLMVGEVTFGAIFPPIAGDGKWVWRLWINGEIHAEEGRAKSELAAKNAIMAKLQDFLRRARLVAE